MKKLLIIISFITVSSLSYAQTFGIKAGPTLASAYGSDVSDVGMKTAFHLGAYGVFGETRDGRTLTVEFLLNQKGFQDSYSETTTSGFSVSTYSITNKVKLNYMDMNAVGNFMVGDLISINAGLNKHRIKKWKIINFL